MSRHLIPASRTPVLESPIGSSHTPTVSPPEPTTSPTLCGLSPSTYKGSVFDYPFHPGSCPFALNTAPADGVVRNLISAFAADESFEPTPTPAWKTV